MYLFLFERGGRIGGGCTVRIKDLDTRNSMILVQLAPAGSKIVKDGTKLDEAH
jgi:hypothetical protein